MRERLSHTTGLERMAVALIVGVAVALLPLPRSLPVRLDGVGRGLLGWCAGVAVYLALAWWLAHSFDAARTRARARSLDQPQLMILVSMLAVVGASLVAISSLLQQVHHLDAPSRGAHLALGLVALAGSWLMIHTIYAFHYAHRYYQNEKPAEPNQPPAADERYELEFPGEEAPDYADFLYYSLVIGMTSQVSDVQVLGKQLRRITLAHSVLSFAFNMLVLALSINVVAGAMA